jgi:peptidoglycan-N-acetylglucosamine deacetylase
MAALSRLLWGATLCVALTSPAFADPCGPIAETQAIEVQTKSTKPNSRTDPDDGVPLGVSRVVEIDASTGPLFGEMTKLGREDSFLGPKEIVLTFDDGPLPWITKSILDTLDRFCTKATFFSVGQMALAYPASVKDVVARGHTLGSHTWSHPMNIGRLSFDKGKDEIERGLAAVALAAGQPIAPFFRFPGLNDSDPLLHYLQTRGIASFTVDVVSNDSFIGNPNILTKRTLAQIEQRDGGILLFHDIKASTAKALPGILKELQARGFKVVHMRAKTPAVPIAELEKELAPVLAETRTDPVTVDATGAVHQLRPFYGSASLLHTPGGDSGAVAPPFTEIAPAARTRVAAAGPVQEGRVLRRQKKLQAAADGGSVAGQPPKLPKLKWRQRPVKKVVQPVNATKFFPF